MKTLIIILGLLVSNWTIAEVYKCTQAGGGIKFSDQPCSLGKATLPSEPTTSKNNVTLSSISASSSVQARKNLPNHDRYTEEELAQRTKAALARLAVDMQEQEALCHNGDGRACCFFVSAGKGKKESFKACAKYHNYPYGDYWLVNNTDSIYDKQKKDMEQAALAQRIPMSEVFDKKMYFFAFAKKIKIQIKQKGNITLLMSEYFLKKSLVVRCLIVCFCDYILTTKQILNQVKSF